jgi:NAD+ synthase
LLLNPAEQDYPVAMRVGLIRHDPVIGDLAGNACAIARALAQAGDLDLLVLGELSLCGYPPRDLLFREGFVEQCEATVRAIARSVPAHQLVLVGTPWRVDGQVVNAVIALRGGEVEAVSAKRLLPAYDVFDEDRYFTPGTTPCIVDVCGHRIGVLVCEDFWQGGDVDAKPYARDPVSDVIDAGADVLVVASASPFIVGKHERQLQRAIDVANDHGVDVIGVNQAGANDDLIFDGSAFVIGASGALRALRAPFDDSTMLTVDLRDTTGIERVAPSADAQRVRALRTAISGYVDKTSTKKVLLGLSGGIDSAVVAALAVSALGPGRVEALTMPASCTSCETLADAQAVASILDIKLDTIAIEDLHAAMRSVLGVHVDDGDLADQNLQARLRGVLLMARSNASGSLVLACGNKSELAVGYATLYGDMCGALCPLGDVLKTDVYAMARWINANGPSIGLPEQCIAERILERPPTAELRPGQCDQDSLPPYEQLDAIIRGIVEQDLDDAACARSSALDLETVAHWRARIDGAQFKREQAAVIPKLSARTFGRGRCWPIVSKLTDALQGEQSAQQVKPKELTS